MPPIQPSATSPLLAQAGEGGRSDSIAQTGTFSGGDRRPSIASIMRQYQVKSEPTVKWQPNWLGVMPLSGEAALVPRTMAKMLDNLWATRGHDALLLVREIKDYAKSSAALQFRGERDGYQDAVRHTFASALLTKEFGPRWTRDFTTANEAKPDNQQGREAMDLYNNSVGIRIASQHPQASEATLRRLVVDALAKGELLVIGAKGHLCWSDQVSQRNTGHDIEPIGRGGRPVPDGNVRPGQ
jgi:hypothetical protein